MKIIFDNIIFYWQRSGGISVVWYELINRFLKGNDYVRFIDYGNTENQYRNKLNISKSQIIKNKNNIFLKILRYLPVPLKIDSTFIFHSTYYRLCKNKRAINFLTVHDFTYEYFKHGIAKWIHCYTKHNAIKKADYIICISDNTKNDLLKFIPNVNPQKIYTIYNGVGNSFRMLDKRHRYNNNKEKYLIYIGGRDKYKNFNLALKTSKITNIKLYIIGKKLSKKEIVTIENSIGKNYCDLGFIEDNELNFIYNNGFALIYPSSYEGFGIPVIEAQKAGCPVIAMNRSSIPEIIGNKELLVDEEDPYLFAEKLKMLENNEFRERIIMDGINNSQKFNWDITFQGYKSLYEIAFQNSKIFSENK